MPSPIAIATINHKKWTYIAIDKEIVMNGEWFDQLVRTKLGRQQRGGVVGKWPSARPQSTTLAVVDFTAGL